MLGSPIQMVATFMWHIVTIILDWHLNPSTALKCDSLSTPSRCSWPIPMHNSLNPPLKELKFLKEHISISLHRVVTNMHIQFLTSISSPRVQSTSTMDVVDILKRRVKHAFKQQWSISEKWLDQISIGCEGDGDVSQHESQRSQMAVFNNISQFKTKILQLTVICLHTIRKGVMNKMFENMQSTYDFATMLPQWKLIHLILYGPCLMVYHTLRMTITIIKLRKAHLELQYLLSYVLNWIVPHAWYTIIT